MKEYTEAVLREDDKVHAYVKQWQRKIQENVESIVEMEL